MSTTQTTQAAVSHAAEPDYLACSKGWKSWLFTLDHKRIGVMYLIAISASFFLGGLFALGIRLELFHPREDFVGPDGYNQLFTLHGAVMVFLFIIPGIPAALGNFVLPLMLGAKDVAFPRMNLASFWLWMFGAVFFVWVLASGGLDTGWTFYTPYSVEAQTAVIAAATGAFILGFSSIFTGINFIVTIHKMRPKGMTWFRMPLFLWGMYATAIIQVLATPVLGITLLLLVFERMTGDRHLRPAQRRRPGAVPALLLVLQPPGRLHHDPARDGIVISELVSVFSRKPIFGYKMIAYSSSWRSRCSASWCGATTCSPAASQDGGRRSSAR